MEPGGIYDPRLLRCSQFVRKGVIWLFLATVAGIIPTVSLASFLSPSFLCLIRRAGLGLPEPERYLFFLLSRNHLIEHYSASNTRCVQHGTSLFLSVTRGASIKSYCSTDVPDSLADYNVNRCYMDVPLFAQPFIL